MNWRYSSNVFNRILMSTLMAGMSLSAPTLHGQKKPVAPLPAVSPASPSPTATLSAGPTYTSADGKGSQKFPQVEAVFSLVGADGKPVALKPSDLQMFSQNKLVGSANSFRSFDQTGYGVTSILAIDASGSMRGAPLNAIHASIAKFVGQARWQDKVGVVTFADDTLMDVPFSHTQSQMTAELQTVKARGTTTRLWDGLLFALDKYKADMPARRLLVVISDGHDEGSQAKLQAVIQRAKELNVVVSSIGLTRDPGQFLHTLQELSAATGGSYRRAKSAADLDGFIQDGLAAQRATPVALFNTTGLTASGTQQPVELRWQPGRLSAATSVLPPLVIDKKPIGKVDRLWLWGLGGCFVAGIILLAISWRSSRRKPMPVEPYPPAYYPPAPAAGMGDNYAGAAPPPPMPYSPTSDVFKPFERPAGGPRVPTLDETDTSPRIAPKQYVPTDTPYVPSEKPYVETHKEPLAPRVKPRSMTQLAGVFNASPEGPYAQLQIKTGELAGALIEVTVANFSIGAVPGNHLVLTGDPTISGRHAQLLWEDGILKVEDNKSTNGTYINGLKLEPGRHVLRPGDELRTGKVIMVVNPA